MDNKEKIFEMLQKDDLSFAEKDELASIINSDPEAKEFYDAYIMLKDAVRSGSHLSYDQLYNYILLINGDEPEDKKISVQLPLIENHLRKCGKCMDEFTLLNEEYANIEEFVSIPDKKESGDPVINTGISQKDKKGTSTLRYSFITVLTAGAFYLLLFFISESTSDLTKYASLDSEQEFYVTRGRVTDNFQKSISELEKENYSEAIKYLKLDIKDNPGDNTIFYSYYILGLTYLETAEKDFIGLFPSYDKLKALNALTYLKKTVELNNSGRFLNITYDSYFYIAKAYLMLEKKEEAVSYLKQVVKNKGAKLNEAQSILSGLK